jgi:hypothetical protein
MQESYTSGVEYMPSLLSQNRSLDIDFYGSRLCHGNSEMNCVIGNLRGEEQPRSCANASGINDVNKGKRTKEVYLMRMARGWLWGYVLRI